MNLKKGDLVYLPAEITLLGSLVDDGTYDRWTRLDEPTLAVVIQPNLDNENIYHKVLANGDDWRVRTIDTLEIVSRD
ncbi:MAG: hypothetical protein ACYS5F_12835 [Planctomycetota bacterium]|jgi:hypothetical protein